MMKAVPGLATAVLATTALGTAWWQAAGGEAADARPAAAVPKAAPPQPRALPVLPALAATRQAATAAGLALEALHARCVNDMVRETCRVMNASEATGAPAEGVVFVAGLGPVQAAVYAELRESGAAMCETVRRHCTTDWSGAACRTARALYGAPG